MKILILFTGNSCRSHMVHAFIHSFDPSIIFCLAGTETSSELNREAFEAKVNVG